MQEFSLEQEIPWQHIIQAIPDDDTVRFYLYQLTTIVTVLKDVNLMSQTGLPATAGWYLSAAHLGLDNLLTQALEDNFGVDATPVVAKNLHHYLDTARDRLPGVVWETVQKLEQYEYYPIMPVWLLLKEVAGQVQVIAPDVPIDFARILARVERFVFLNKKQTIKY